MAKMYTKPGMKNKPIMSEDQKQSDEPYGTVWPKVIGHKRKQERHNKDGKICDSRGLVMEGLFDPKR